MASDLISKAHSPLKTAASKADYRDQIYQTMVDFKLQHRISDIVEPFVGGANLAPVYMAFATLSNNIKKITYNDFNEDITRFWALVAVYPERVIARYEAYHKRFVEDSAYYYVLRDEYNQLPNGDNRAYALAALQRFCFGGKMQYNKEGQYVTTHAKSRVGMKPETFAKFVMQWHKVLNAYPHAAFALPYGEFFSKIEVSDKTFIFLDPPYQERWGKGEYGGNGAFDFDAYYKMISEMSQRGVWCMSAVPTKDFTFYADKYNIAYQVVELTHKNDNMNSGKTPKTATKRHINLFLSGGFCNGY